MYIHKICFDDSKHDYVVKNTSKLFVTVGVSLFTSPPQRHPRVHYSVKK